MMDNTSWWPRAIHDVIVLILARSWLASTATLSFVHRELWLLPGPTCNVHRIGGLIFCRFFFTSIYRQVENFLGIGLPERAVAGTPRAPHCNKRVKFDRYPTLMNSNLFQRYTPEQQKKQCFFLSFLTPLSNKAKPKTCSRLTNLVDWDLKQLWILQCRSRGPSGD